MQSTSRVNRVLSGVVAWSVASLGLATVGLSVGAASAEAAVSPVVERSPAAVTANPLPTVQIDGVAWSQTVVGNTVYAGGQFGNARPAGAAVGTSQTVRNNLLAYDITTGNLATGFNPNLNGQVKVLATSPDKRRLYVGGSFTTANGTVRNRIAAYDTATGALVSSFAPNFNGTVTALTATDSTVYVAGWFNTVNGQPRTRLAAVTAATGALTTWTATLDADPTSIVLTPDQSKIVVGGKFQNVSGSAQQGITALHPATAAVLDWQVNRVVRNGNDLSGTYSLSVDNDTVYGASFNYGTGNFEGIFAMNQDGSIRWLADCHGDTYASFSVNNIVYSAGHPHHCSNIGGFYENNPRWEWRATAFTKEVTGEVQPNNQFGSGYGDFRGQPSPSLVHWFPQFAPGRFTGQAQAVWSLSGNSTYVVAGGEFPSVNGKAQQGLARFASSPTAASSGATQLGGASNPSVRPLGNYAARISWSANWDRDDRNLTYKLIRSDKAATPLDTRTVASSFWERPVQSFTDTSVEPGQTYRYRVVVADPSGVGTQSDYVSVTIPTTPLSSYAKAVIDDGAVNYFRLDDAGSATMADLAGGNDLSGGTGVTSAPTGAIAGDDDGAATLTSPNGIGTKGAVQGPNTFSAETWIRTRSTAGGKILGFGDSATGSSGSYDRHVFMDKEGRLIFGVHPGGVRTVSSATGFNDGEWHHVVAQLSPAGQTLYIDGLQVGSNPSTTSGQEYNGFWRIGNDNLNGWPGSRDTSAFSGDIDETAIYPTALTVTQIRDHYAKSGRTLDLPSQPTDAYGATVYKDDPTLFWRLDDSAGPAVRDAGTHRQPGTASGGTTFGVSSPVTTSAGRALRFDGVDGTVASVAQATAPLIYSEELWFNTTTDRGGKLIGFGNQQSGFSSSYDKHVYMTADGRLNFGVWTGTENVVRTPDAYNDGAWHHVVATQGAGGMHLYVDGVLTGTHPQTGGDVYPGYWRVGGDSGWSGANFFAGSIDEVSVYPRVLTADQVRAHYAASPAATGAANAAPEAAFTSTVQGMAVAFDGSGSRDADGTVASYAWDFGDGTTGTGSTTNHTYTRGGTFTVKLTVTDNDGAVGSISKTVSVSTPNQAPKAAFTSTAAGLAVALDASGSSDADGSIASYAWKFGDGRTGTGETTDHTYTAAGTYTVELTVTDDQGETASSTDTITVSATNAAPRASFTSAVDGSVVTLDASESSDTDGSIASYAWDFGNGRTGTGATTTQTYAAGTYTVKLTVTDDDGATDTSTASVTVAAAPSPTLAVDEFDRTGAGWGTADTGGAWTVGGGASNFSTTGTAGAMRMPATSTIPTATLESVSASDVVVTTDVSVDKVANGTGLSTMVMARRESSRNYYWVKVRHMADGSVNLAQGRRLNGAETTFREIKVAGLTYAPGTKLRVQLKVSGTSTATLTAKVWAAAGTEPTAAQITSTDSSTGLAAAGSVGLRTYTSGSTTNVPVTLSVDRFTAVRP